MKNVLALLFLLTTFNLFADDLSSEDMDRVDEACLYQSLESKHKGIVATKAYYDKKHIHINIECSDGNKLRVFSLSHERQKKLHNSLLRKEKRLCQEGNELTYKLNHASENVGTLPYKDCGN